MDRQIFHEGERRAGIGGRATDRPITVTDEDEREFQMALEQYKRRSGRQFPTWSEILEILRAIGYEKRIWRPVSTWSPMLASHPAEDGLVGWYARVETPVGP